MRPIGEGEQGSRSNPIVVDDDDTLVVGSPPTMVLRTPVRSRRRLRRRIAEERKDEEKDHSPMEEMIFAMSDDELDRVNTYLSQLRNVVHPSNRATR